MPNKVVIESYGTPDTTRIFFDDIEQQDVRSFDFNVDVDDIVSSITITYAIYNKDATELGAGKLDELALNAINKGVEDESVAQVTKESDKEETSSDTN